MGTIVLRCFQSDQAKTSKPRLCNEEGEKNVFEGTRPLYLFAGRLR